MLSTCTLPTHLSIMAISTFNVAPRRHSYAGIALADHPARQSRPQKSRGQLYDTLYDSMRTKWNDYVEKLEGEIARKRAVELEDKRVSDLGLVARSEIMLGKTIMVDETDEVLVDKVTLDRCRADSAESEEAAQTLSTLFNSFSPPTSLALPSPTFSSVPSSPTFSPLFCPSFSLVYNPSLPKPVSTQQPNILFSLSNSLQLAADEKRQGIARLDQYAKRTIEYRYSF